MVAAALYRGEGAPDCGLTVYLLTDHAPRRLDPPAFVEPCEKLPPVVNGILVHQDGTQPIYTQRT
jgi:hypothetical protein